MKHLTMSDAELSTYRFDLHRNDRDEGHAALKAVSVVRLLGKSESFFIRDQLANGQEGEPNPPAGVLHSLYEGVKQQFHSFFSTVVFGSASNFAQHEVKVIQEILDRSMGFLVSGWVD